MARVRVDLQVLPSEGGHASEVRPTKSVEVVRSRGAAIASLAAAAVTVASLVAIPFTNYSEQTTPMGLAYVAFMAFGCSLAAFLGWYQPARRGVAVVARAGELMIDQRAPQRFDRGQAAVLRDGRAQVDLGMWPRSIRLEVDDIARARALLSQLGLDRRAGTSRFRVAKLRLWREPEAIVIAMATFFLLLTFAAVGGLLLTLGAMVTLLMAGAALFVAHLRRRQELTVGADGIELKRRWSRRLFIPHARIRGIERVNRLGRPRNEADRHVSPGFMLVLDDGTLHLIDTREERFRTNVWETDPIFDALRAARDAARTGPAAAVLVLARGARTQADWIESLRAAARQGRTGYRVAAIDPRQLFELLVDPNVSQELRAAAAITLGATEEHGPRLRVAADDLADAAVRRIAVAAAERDDEALEAEVSHVLEREATTPSDMVAPPSQLFRDFVG